MKFYTNPATFRYAIAVPMSKRIAACGCEISKTIPKGVPFAIMPTWVLKSGVSPRALQLYLLLHSFQNDKHTAAFPSRATLVEEGMGSTSAVDRAMVELMKIGAISTKRRFNTSSLYSVHVEPCLVTTTPKNESSPQVFTSSNESSPQTFTSLNSGRESSEINEVNTPGDGLIKVTNKSEIFEMDKKEILNINKNKKSDFTRFGSDPQSIGEIFLNSFSQLQVKENSA
jgi:hypothetical protein